MRRMGTRALLKPLLQNNMQQHNALSGIKSRNKMDTIDEVIL